MLKAGDTVLMPKDLDSTPHLWIISTDPDASRHVVIVNVTTLRPHSDRTTILKRGDHPYIEHDSVVFYADARIVDSANVENLVRLKGDLAIQCDACSDELLQRVRGGLLDSENTPNKVLAYCKAQWNLG